MHYLPMDITRKTKGFEHTLNDKLPSRKSRRKNGSNGGPLIWIILIATFLIAVCGGAYYATSTSLFDKPEEKKPTPEKRMEAHDKTIVMLMGVDQREDDVGRSDTLMVAMLDPKKYKVALLSVPRDTRVKIKRYGYDKINSAYAYGGHQLTQSTVEDLIGVSVEHYVQIDVHAFQRIIDALGGVDIDVEKRMYYEDPWDDDGGLVIDLYPGEQHMDGETAITYVRYRDEEGDIGRIARQQKFMQAVLDKMTSPTIIPRLPAVVKEVFSCVETDMSLRQMLEFANSLIDAQKYGVETEMIPGIPMYIDGVSYWVPDLKKLRTTVAQTLDVTPSSSDVSAWEQEYREYQRALPSGATSMTLSDYNRRLSNDEDRTDEIRKRKEMVDSRQDDEDEDDDDRDDEPQRHNRRDGGNDDENTSERRNHGASNRSTDYDDTDDDYSNNHVDVNYESTRHHVPAPETTTSPEVTTSTESMPAPMLGLPEGKTP